MIKTIKIALILALCFMVTQLYSGVVMAGGIGVSPPDIEIQNALKGEKIYEREIKIFNLGSYTSDFSFEVDGECKEWISFYKINDSSTPITSISIPENDSANILIKIKIPVNIANDLYNSTVYITSAPLQVEENTTETGVQMQTSVPVAINVVGEQILTGVVESIKINDMEVNYPLSIDVKIKNTGNVNAKPKLQINIKKNKFNNDVSMQKIKTSDIVFFHNNSFNSKLFLNLGEIGGQLEFISNKIKGLLNIDSTKIKTNLLIRKSYFENEIS